MQLNYHKKWELDHGEQPTNPNKSSERSQMISRVVLAIEQSSDSAEERDTICCFLHFQEMSEEPRSTQEPQTERWVLS